MSSPEVTVNDQKAKQKMKTYADNTRNTRDHNIRIGDTVLLRQRRHNKFSTPFEPTPYIAESVKGTMVTARRTTDQRKITRNSSHYKIIKESEVEEAPAEDQIPWNFEADSGNSNFSETAKENTYLPETEEHEIDDSLKNPTQFQTVEEPIAEVRRSGRTRRKPVWKKNINWTERSITN